MTVRDKAISMRKKGMPFEEIAMELAISVKEAFDICAINTKVDAAATPAKKPMLILTVGLPYSGKSTWALRQGVPIVCPDAVRLAVHGERYLAPAEPVVWMTVRYMVEALFLAGHDTVIVDATNNTRKRRDAWLSEKWKVAFQVVEASVEQCIRRARKDGDDLIVPVIQRMWDQREVVTLKEREEAVS